MKTTYYYFPSPPYESGRTATFDDQAFTVDVVGTSGNLHVDCTVYDETPAVLDAEGNVSTAATKVVNADKTNVKYAQHLAGFAHFPTTKPFSDTELTDPAKAT